MAIIYNKKSQVFTLHTDKSTYQMKITEYGFLAHLYYGRRILDDELTVFAEGMGRGFFGNPYEAGTDRTFSQDALPQEFPVFGEGDYRSSCIQGINGDGSYDVDLRYQSHNIMKGKPRLEGLPSTYGDEDEVNTLEIVLIDSVSNLEVVLSYSVFEKYDVITRCAKAVNRSTNKLILDKMLSCCLDFPNKDQMDILTFYGRHAMERMPERSNIRHGKTVIGSVRGCSSHQHNPFVILCDSNTGEMNGDCYGLSFVYSGNFIVEAEKDQLNQIRVVMGIEPTAFSMVLENNESFQSPEVVLSYSYDGFSKLSDNYHRLYRTNLCRGKYKTIRRPILVNNWEATYFNFNEDKLFDIAKAAAEIGIEMLVIDDGWFGKRNDDMSSLGDWYVNSDKFNQGLSYLCKRVNEIGVKLGIWLEPEMISEDSELFRNHPDWCLKVPGRKGIRSRYQFVLDMSNKEIRDYLYDVISKILDSANIEYIKWDMNRHLTNVYSKVLPPERQGEVYHRYVLGLYELLERLVTNYPDVLFESCSGGGGRFDAGMLYYTPQIWCSDNTDSIDRITIQYGTTFGYPVSAISAHVSASPNHQTHRATSLNTRGIVAMSGAFGYELDISQMTQEEKDIMREQIRLYKKQYDLIALGTYYRLTNPIEQKSYAAWAFVSPDRKYAIVNYVLLEREANPTYVTLRFCGLDERKKYQVEGGGLYSGAALMYAGYRMPKLYSAYDCVQLNFVSIEKR